MSQRLSTPMSRIDARIPLAVRETIDRAAAMQGRSRTDFLVMAALEKAEKVIMEQNLVQLAVEDQLKLAKALAEEKVEQPTALLKDIAAEYAAKVKSI